MPAFPGQRPPFTPGHTLSVQHGAWSPRRVDPLAADMVAVVEGDPEVTWLRTVDRPALWAWARAEARVQLVEEYLMAAAAEAFNDVGDLDADRVKSAYLLLHRFETRAATLRSQLGMTPLSRARLGRDTAAGHLDAARLMAELHKQEQDEKGVTTADPLDDKQGDA